MKFRQPLSQHSKTMLGTLGVFIEQTDLEFNMGRHETCFIGMLHRMLGADTIRPNALWFAETVGMNFHDASDMCIDVAWTPQRKLGEITREEATRFLWEISQ